MSAHGNSHCLANKPLEGRRIIKYPLDDDKSITAHFSFGTSFFFFESGKYSTLLKTHRQKHQKYEKKQEKGFLPQIIRLK